MTTLVFGHKSPDTDATCSPIIWAWYLNEVKNIPAKPILLGQPNTEAKFVLEHCNIKTPEIIDDVMPGQRCVVVDTNNPAELPDNINAADLRRIIDHHLLTGGLRTNKPIEMTIRPVACTATIMYDLMGEDVPRMPDAIRCLMLSCIISDTLEFRSPTTTPHDRQVAETLAQGLGVLIPEYAAEMFAAKSDVSAFSDAELLRMDSKVYEISGSKFRISVLETTSPEMVLERKDGLMKAMETVAAEDGVVQVLLFVIDILNKEATLLLPNEQTKAIAAKSFEADTSGDTVVLPGVVSRKKQITPNLKV